MPRRKKRPPLYGTKEVARMLQIPEWRVKNFTEGGAYGLPPSVQIGHGRGGRRLYGWLDVCRMLIANELVNCGFTPEATGRAVREIPESKLIGREGLNSVVLAQVGGEWDVITQEALGRQIKLGLGASLIIVPFQQLILDLGRDIERDFEEEILRRDSPEEWEELQKLIRKSQE